MEQHDHDDDDEDDGIDRGWWLVAEVFSTSTRYLGSGANKQFASVLCCGLLFHKTLFNNFLFSPLQHFWFSLEEAVSSFLSTSFLRIST